MARAQVLAVAGVAVADATAAAAVSSPPRQPARERAARDESERAANAARAYQSGEEMQQYEMEEQAWR